MSPLLQLGRLSWTLSEDMITDNTDYKTWLQAKQNRKITDNHIFNSDIGVQYTAKKMTLLSNDNKVITQRMSSKGNCQNSVLGKSFLNISINNSST